jgi:hypothetical protein
MLSGTLMIVVGGVAFVLDWIEILMMVAAFVLDWIEIVVEGIAQRYNLPKIVDVIYLLLGIANSLQVCNPHTKRI